MADHALTQNAANASAALNDVAAALAEAGISMTNVPASDYGDKVREAASGGGGSVEKKDVNFYDFDGTLLYSYTFAEVAELTELPPVPTKTGKTAHWNYTLADILAQTGEWVDVKVFYTVDSGATELHMEFATDGRLEPTLNFALKSGSVTIDWGDGSTPDVVTEKSSVLTDKDISHVYSFNAYPATATISLSYSGTGELALNRQVLDAKYRCFLKNVYLGSINSIGSQTFKDCYTLSNVSIPNSVTSIGSQAFYNCYTLASVSIPNSVTSIDNYAFQYCSSLASVSIPNSVKNTGEYVFQSCYSLTNVSIPNGVTVVKRNLFENCYSLTNVSIPNSVTRINYSAFQYCSLAIVSIPNSVTNIDPGIINGCSSMKYLDMSAYGNNDTFPQLGGNIAWNVPSDFTILVKNETKKTELSGMTNWSQYTIEVKE